MTAHLVWLEWTCPDPNTPTRLRRVASPRQFPDHHTATRAADAWTADPAAAITDRHATSVTIDLQPCHTCATCRAELTRRGPTR